jgi:hypothetical protein
MVSAPLRTPRMSVELFRSFVEGRPDEEHWELIDGVAMMVTPATLEHQRTASNLERLLLDALESHAPTSAQASGLLALPPSAFVVSLPISIGARRSCRADLVRPDPHRRKLAGRLLLAGMPVAIGQMIRNRRGQETGHPPEHIVAEGWL